MDVLHYLRTKKPMRLSNDVTEFMADTRENVDWLYVACDIIVVYTIPETSKSVILFGMVKRYSI